MFFVEVFGGMRFCFFEVSVFFSFCSLGVFDVLGFLRCLRFLRFLRFLEVSEVFGFV